MIPSFEDGGRRFSLESSLATSQVGDQPRIYEFKISLSGFLETLSHIVTRQDKTKQGTEGVAEE